MDGLSNEWYSNGDYDVSIEEDILYTISLVGQTKFRGSEGLFTIGLKVEHVDHAE